MRENSVRAQSPTRDCDTICNQSSIVTVPSANTSSRLFWLGKFLWKFRYSPCGFLELSISRMGGAGASIPSFSTLSLEKIPLLVKDRLNTVLGGPTPMLRLSRVRVLRRTNHCGIGCAQPGHDPTFSHPLRPALAELSRNLFHRMYRCQKLFEAFREDTFSPFVYRIHVMCDQHPVICRDCDEISCDRSSI